MPTRKASVAQVWRARQAVLAAKLALDAVVIATAPTQALLDSVDSTLTELSQAIDALREAK